MKTALITTVLLVLAAPALAATAHPSMRATIRQFEDLYAKCQYVAEPGDACAVADKLAEKLEARGYCIHGKGVVGKAGRKYFYPGIDSAGTNSGMTRHCYIIRQ